MFPGRAADRLAAAEKNSVTQIATLADTRAVEAEMPLERRWAARSLYEQLAETAARSGAEPSCKNRRSPSILLRITLPHILRKTVCSVIFAISQILSIILLVPAVWVQIAIQ